ncbi:MAG: hypothetical protein HUU43_16180, partial [Ignavibacteriaceae bacterium]|nr:hypothetical protein [Ignavibacteriaceae bacterium]
MDQVSGLPPAEERGEAEAMSSGVEKDRFDGLTGEISKLHSLLASGCYGSVYLAELSELIMFLSAAEERSFFDANFEEFRADFIHLLGRYSAIGIAPLRTEKILVAAETFRRFSGSDSGESIDPHTSRIGKELQHLKGILNGSPKFRESGAQGLYFPLIEISGSEIKAGRLDKIEITLTPSKSENQFRILSKYNRADETLPLQIKTSFLNARSQLSLRKDGRSKDYFNVFVSFTGDLGEYSGDSLGAILTLSFMLELYNFYYRQKT